MPTQPHAVEEVQVVSAAEEARLVAEQVHVVGDRLATFAVGHFERKRVVAVVDQLELLGERGLAVGQETPQHAVVGVVDLHLADAVRRTDLEAAADPLAAANFQGKVVLAVDAAHCSTDGPAVTYGAAG